MRLSSRDNSSIRTAAPTGPTSVWSDQSETSDSFPKQHWQMVGDSEDKPDVTVHIRMDPLRKDIQRNEAMGLNALNQLERA